MGRYGAADYLVLAFTVDITRTTTSDGAIDLGMCEPGSEPIGMTSLRPASAAEIAALS